MSALSNLLNILGLVLLAHAVYSAYEHALIAKDPAAVSQQRGGIMSSLDPNIDLPLDITLETLFSILILCVGVVLGSPELKPIQWREWAGKQEREKSDDSKVGDAGFVSNPYKALDERVGFLDIRAKRTEFAEWVKEGGSVKTKS